jgi:2-phosphosulfolactate phosphatase
MTSTPGSRIDLEVYALPSHLLVPGAPHAPQRPPVCIVLDVVRATSTMVLLFERGATRIHVSRDLDSGLRMVQSAPGRYVDFAEDIYGRRAPGFTWPTSPAENAAAPVQGREVVFCTVNGTGCIHAAVLAGARGVLLGSFRNATAVATRAADLALAHDAPVVLVGSGRFGNRSAALEDVACGGYLGRLVLDRLKASGRTPFPSDSFVVAERLYLSYGSRVEALRDSGSGRGLMRNGAPEADFDICAALDTTTIVPEVPVAGGAPAHPVQLIRFEGAEGVAEGEEEGEEASEQGGDRQ